MASINMIGGFFFITLEGSPAPPVPRVEPETRPGVNGVQLTVLGTQPEMFTLRSKVDAESYFDARTMFALYCSLIGGAPQPCIRGSYDLSSEGFLVAVLNVREVTCKALRLAVGGLNPPSLGWLEADWDLLPVSF